MIRWLPFAVLPSIIPHTEYDKLVFGTERFPATYVVRTRLKKPNRGVLAVNIDPSSIQPATLLQAYMHLFKGRDFTGKVLDIAAGDCHNANFLALSGLRVVACDRSKEALDAGWRTATKIGVTIETWQVDLERKGINPLPLSFYGGIIVFRYLHRPLIPCIRKSLKTGGVLIYETFTVDQPRFGKPHNPDYLLNFGELYRWFEDWKMIHYFEGVLQDPERAVAQIVCQKRDQQRPRLPKPGP